MEEVIKFSVGAMEEKHVKFDISKRKRKIYGR